MSDEVMELDSDPTLTTLDTWTEGAQALAIPQPTSITPFFNPSAPQLYPSIPLPFPLPFLDDEH